jgi:DNA-binding response OmpR family regulator
MAHILIVDDEPLIAMLAEEWLVELGHTAAGPAYDLATALSIADTPIDGAIIDLSLGKDTGYPIAKLLAQKNVPFAFATGDAYAAANPEYGAVAILSKPFAFEAFKGAVHTLLKSN